MNLFEAQEFFKNLNPGKEVKFEFDDNCIRQIEIVHTDGLPHVVNHVEYGKVKVIVDSQQPVYVPISPHRMNTTILDIKNHVNNFTDFHVNSSTIEGYQKASDEEKQTFIGEMVKMSGFSKDHVENKLKR